MSAGSERSCWLALGSYGQSVFALFGHMVPLCPRHCLPSVVQESLTRLVDNTWLFVERLASFVASVSNATRFLKNAWRPFWRPFLRRLVFVVALGKKSRPRGLRRCFVTEKKMRFKIK